MSGLTAAHSVSALANKHFDIKPVPFVMSNEKKGGNDCGVFVVVNLSFDVEKEPSKVIKLIK